MPETDEFSSWLESRRLIIAQLASMDSSIRELSGRIDKLSETSRERTIELSAEAQTRTADLNLRVAMLELRAKLWGGVIGLMAGGVATAVVQLITRSLER